MRKLSQGEIVVIIAAAVVLITVNSYFRVRAMGAAERQRAEHLAAVAAMAEAGTGDAEADAPGETDAGSDGSNTP